MVIEHNIPGLNANRNRDKNRSALAKSLEKLSSGYAVNRAADNAAGLAVSEKMRSQIGGMKQSVKNCRDGISLIQTFEGALEETIAIIKRAKTLADQMANGTYEDNVDRSAVEIEYIHLCDEIDHIADTDFNGIVMLSGKMDNAAGVEACINRALNEIPDTPVQTFMSGQPPQEASAQMLTAELSPQKAVPQKMTALSSKAAVFAAPKAAGTVCGDFTVYGDPGNFSFDTGTGVLTVLGGDVTVEGTGAATTNTIVVAKDKSANVTLRDVNIDVSGTGSVDPSHITLGTAGIAAFKIEDNSKGNVTISLEGDNILKGGCGCAGLQKNGGSDTGMLTITGNGTVNAFGGDSAAGIGGGYYSSTENIIIDSGNVTGKGGRGAAGIGSGHAKSRSSIKLIRETGRNIIINGGTVTARGGADAAGIGGGWGGTGSDIIINGGVVYAYGCGNGDVINNMGFGGAGIGGGRYGAGENITINNGVVHSEGAQGGSGIGSGQNIGKEDCEAKNITINNGTVTAIGGRGGSGIGGGCSGGTCNGIKINGGTVTATGRGWGAGIGGGETGNGIGIVICGGTVTATSSAGAGIGGGGGFAIVTSYHEPGGKGEVTITGKDTIVITKGGKSSDDIGSGENSKEASTVNIDNILTKEPYAGNGITDGTIVHYTGTNPTPPAPDNPDPPTPIIPDKPNTPNNSVLLTNPHLGNKNQPEVLSD